MLKVLLREPLVHFVGLALILFALLPKDPSNNDLEILVSDHFVQGLAEDSRRKSGGDLSEADLIASFIRDETLYREGMSLGLNLGDAIVRRRVVQKMELLIRDNVEVGEPSDKEIDEFRGVQPGGSLRVSFEQAYFSKDVRKDPTADAKKALLDSESWSEVPGDPFPLGSKFASKTLKQVTSQFGSEFAESLFELPVGGFQGPVKSALGVHLVRVSRREEVAMNKKKARLRLLEKRRLEETEKAINTLIKRYKVRRVAD